ncbi:MAG: hypothetical protein VYD90_10690 [Pseudomonadota bacterium]|nr:hypothetical protein [Pseudomonadota bacterium]
MSTISRGNNQDYRVLREQVEVLMGKRGNRGNAAMTQGDAQDLREFIANLRKGTADVQRDLRDMVDTVASTQEALSQIGNDIEDTQTAVASAQQLLSQLEASLAAANVAIQNLSDETTNAADAINEIRTAAAGVNTPTLNSETLDPLESPTAADFNSLRGDVTAIRAALLALREALT